MPLRLRCKSCSRELLVEDVFQGAQCRCGHCRSLIHVPRVVSALGSRPAARPERPSLAHDPLIPAPVRVSTTPARAAPSAPRGHRTSVGYRVGSGLFVFFTLSLGVVVWRATEEAPSRLTGSFRDDYRGDGEPAALEAQSAIATADPLFSYFGIPLVSGTIGYVVDSDSTMAAYLDDVAFVTHAVNAVALADSRQFGIVQAVSDPEGRQILKVHEPSTDLVGARSTLTGTLAGGETDLPEALSLTTNWYADQVFVVLSKQVDEPQIEQLREQALQTGAVTHVIALGEAARQDLSSISEPTGGIFRPVSDPDLGLLVARCREALPEDVKLP